MKQIRILSLTARTIETEPLTGYRMTILQTTKTHVKVAAVSQARQFTGNKLGIVADFLQPHAEVLAAPPDLRWLRSGQLSGQVQNLVHEEIRG